jgi:TetR/AcrR family transcriptional regulator, mexJK operon transcriptional repressor
MSENDRKPRGRPKDLEKRATILQVARRLFFEQGFEAVRMDQVAIEANVSKMTVYANFLDKAAIFEAVVALEGEQIDATFGDFKYGLGPIDVNLTQVGLTLMTFLMSSDVMRLDQMLSSEMNNYPGLGSRFYQAGPMRIWQEVTEIISAANVRGVVAVGDARQAAEDLISLWLGMVPVQYRFNGLQTISDEQISARVVHGVAVFMKAYGPRI